MVKDDKRPVVQAVTPTMRIARAIAYNYFDPRMRFDKRFYTLADDINTALMALEERVMQEIERGQNGSQIDVS